MSSDSPQASADNAQERVPKWQPPRKGKGAGGTSPQVEKALVDVRRKIYPRSVTGVFARWRVWMVYFTQIIFYGLPWIEWHGRQAVLFDLLERKFYIFGMILWPQDVIYLTVLLLISAFSLFLFTAMAGRLFCGYACPQTVYTEIFMWVERKVEGDRLARIRLDEQPWTLKKLRIKALKHLLWVVIALWTGYTFIGYFAPIRELGGELIALSLGPWQWFWLLFYAFATWGNAGFMREAVCKYMCPYARFQSVMVDRDTFVVTYDFVRGETRGGRSRKIDHKEAGMGDCVDCSLCVQVCPTGIDIRNGLQAACIGCGLCIDACDDVMGKVHAPKGLIRMASLHELGGAASSRRPFLRRVWRTRVWVYGGLLTLVIAATVAAFATRPEVRMNVIRDRSVMARQVEQGAVENVYTLQLMNASDHTRRVVVAVEPSRLVSLHQPITAELGPAQATTITATVRMPSVEAAQHAGEVVPIRFVVASPERAGQAEVDEPSTFLVPR